MYYGENIGGWASTKPDGDFVHGVLFHPYEDIYHNSSEVRRILKGVHTTRTDRQAPVGRMYIDLDAKIAAARSEEEAAAWKAQQEHLKDSDFCAGWHVGIYKQTCGHWEVLQSPIYDKHRLVNGQPYTAEDADRELREQSAERKCTRCICRS